MNHSDIHLSHITNSIVYHLNRHHHSHYLYSTIQNENRKIQSSEHPSVNYKMAMKEVERRASRKEGVGNKSQNEKKGKMLKRNQIEGEGMLAIMKKEKQRRKEIMKNWVNRQQAGEKKFLQAKNSRVLEKKVNLGQQNKNWYAEQDKRAKLNLKLQKQTQLTNMHIMNRNKQKQNQLQQYKKQERKAFTQNSIQIDSLMQKKMMKEKQMQARNMKSLSYIKEKGKGHNPITNPIQFRIQNPYILLEIKKNK